MRDKTKCQVRLLHNTQALGQIGRICTNQSFDYKDRVCSGILFRYGLTRHLLADQRTLQIGHMGQLNFHCACFAIQDRTSKMQDA